MNSSTADRIDRRTSFQFIRYANCWEDARVLCAALRPRSGMRILSICSAGDNSLALLADGAQVVAADLSVAQLACLDLRKAAFRRLQYPELLAFLGVRPTDDRLRTYERLAADLARPSQEFWSQHRQRIASGIIHAGRFEDYFRKFRRWVLPAIHSRATIAKLFEAKDATARKQFWDQQWNNRRWRLLFRVFFSKFLLGRLGRDPEFFRYAQGPISERILRRTEHALTLLPTHDNPFLHYIVYGNFGETLPDYLLPEKFDAIRAGLDRLTLVQGSIEEVGRTQGGEFDAFNLSDIFEYLDPESSRKLYGELIEIARPGARLAYWNTFVPRSCPVDLLDKVRPLKDVARDLFQRDRAFFYDAFEVDEVVQPNVHAGSPPA
jgi:S-adenosylmethionine-diacylglycerol 3-amino-3-carboxypropyl transferase